MEKLIEIIKDNWLKLRSVPIAMLILCVSYVSFITTATTWNGFTIEGVQYLYWTIPFFAAFLIYFFACLLKNRLPKAAKNTLAVLFCIDAESEKLYESAKFKLVDVFKSSLIGDGKARFDALCVRRSDVSRYDLQTKSGSLALLQKTHCVFIVFVRYTADDVSDAENFELRIDYGVRHPDFDKAADAVLSHDMAALQKTVGKQRFVKANTIEVFDFTVQTLVCACQYILGFVYLLAGDSLNARTLLLLARDSIVKEYSQIIGAEKIKELIEDRLFATLCQIAIDQMLEFQKTKQPEFLYRMALSLESANSIHPDTYFYNLNMAYAHIAVSGDAASARICIDKCKQAKADDKIWVYSDAFLSAYCGQAPGTILAKYRTAFRVQPYNLVELVDYIEFVIAREPQRIALHLAAGLVYEAMGEVKLKKQHLAVYLGMANKLDQRTAATVFQKLQADSCNISCDQQCAKCS